jgi:hypothetical protein
MIGINKYLFFQMKKNISDIQDEKKKSRNYLGTQLKLYFNIFK